MSKKRRSYTALEQLLRQQESRIKELERQLAESRRQTEAAKRKVREARTEVKKLKSEVIKPAEVKVTSKPFKIIRPAEVQKAANVEKMKSKGYSEFYTPGPFDGMVTNKGLASALNKIQARYPEFYNIFMKAKDEVYNGDLDEILREFSYLYFTTDGHSFDYNSEVIQVSESGVANFLERINILAENRGVDFSVDTNLYVI